MPLDRAHAHARWAERYDAQGDTQRSVAHFGRAVHYTQVSQAFGSQDRGPWPREADLGNIGIGLWENGAEAWYTLQNQHYSEGPTAAKMRKRMQQVLRGHGPLKAQAGSARHLRRALPVLLDALYASEASGAQDSVHRDALGRWYIHREGATGIVYLVNTLVAKNEDHVRDLVGMLRNTTGVPYTYALSNGLIIVQDQRPGCVRVKRAGHWEPATESETFVYYDFLLEYPHHDLTFNFQKTHADRGPTSRMSIRPLWATVPSAPPTEQNLKFTRDRGAILVSYPDDSGGIRPHQISDVAWRRPS